jgi:hypothetical protein
MTGSSAKQQMLDTGVDGGYQQGHPHVVVVLSQYHLDLTAPAHATPTTETDFLQCSHWLYFPLFIITSVVCCRPPYANHCFPTHLLITPGMVGIVFSSLLPAYTRIGASAIRSSVHERSLPLAKFEGFPGSQRPSPGCEQHAPKQIRRYMTCSWPVGDM